MNKNFISWVKILNIIFISGFVGYGFMLWLLLFSNWNVMFIVFYSMMLSGALGASMGFSLK